MVMTKHQDVFEINHGLSPSHGENDHGIPIIPRNQPPNMHPHKHIFVQKNEIENIIQKWLKVGVILPSISPYSTPMVMVLEKEGNWCMCPNFLTLNKLIIKDKFPNLVIDEFFG